jgi:hypothetical protein
MNELVCGSVGTGKTTYIRELIDYRINHKEHSMVLTNNNNKRIYWKDESDLFESASYNDFIITDDNNTPSSFARYLLNRYILHACKQDNMCLFVDDFNFDFINPDYKAEAFYDAIVELFKIYDISTVFTYNYGDTPKELAFESVPKRMIKTADRVTFLKTV